MKRLTRKQIPRIPHKRSYWTVENVLKELKRFCSENKGALKTQSLSSLLYGKKRLGLYDAVQKFGGLNKLNNKFGLGLKLRRRNYWTDKKIIEELKAIHYSGYKITDRLLRALKRNDLSGAISTRGSIAYFKEKTGLYPRKNWSKREIIKVYKELNDRLGVVPTTMHIRENDGQGMESAMYKIFGSLTALRVASNIGIDRNPPGHWTLKKIVTQLKAFCIKNKAKLKTRAIGSLLHQTDSKLYSAVCESGGFRKLNKQFKLGLKLESHDWTETEISAELKKLQSKGIAVNQVNVKKLKAPFLRSAVIRKLQIPDFRKKLGLPVVKRVNWSKEKVLDEYRAICLRLGKFPLDTDLAEMGKSGLLSAGRKFFENTYRISEILNMQKNRRPRNYWTLENTVKELKNAIAADPHYKGDIIQKLRRQKRYDLAGAVYKHKGLRKLNKKFDLRLDIRGKALSKKEAIKELEILNTNGILITQATLTALGRNDLLVAASRFGGLNSFKKKLGLAITRQNYWSDEKIIMELKPIVASFGRIPSENVLKAMGKSDLASAIEKYGRVKKFSQLMNVPSTGYFKANDGHYLNSGYECLFDNILSKYNVPHTVNERIIPTAQYRYDFLIGETYIEICGYDEKEHPAYFKRLTLKTKLYDDLNFKYRIIEKKFFCKKFDEIEREVLKMVSLISPTQPLVSGPVKNCVIPNHYWKDLGNVKKELLPLVKKYGRIPFDRELRKEKKSSLIHGVYKYHGTFYDVAKKLNLKIMYKPKGFYTFETALMEYKLLCTKHKRYLSQKELHQKGFYGLMGYIAKFGGLQKIRPLTKLNYEIKRLPTGYYTSEKAQEEYKQLCIQKNKLLSSKELAKMKKVPLAAYIQKNGGYFEIRKLAGLSFPALRKPKNFWTPKTTKAAYDELVLELKRRPVSADFKNKQALLGAIAKFGGLTHVNLKWGKMK